MFWYFVKQLSIYVFGCLPLTISQKNVDKAFMPTTNSSVYAWWKRSFIDNDIVNTTLPSITFGIVIVIILGVFFFVFPFKVFVW